MTGPTCKHCGGLHGPTCPRIKSIEYDGDSITKIEYHDHLPRLDNPPPEDKLDLSHGGSDD